MFRFRSASARAHSRIRSPEVRDGIEGGLAKLMADSTYALPA